MIGVNGINATPSLGGGSRWGGNEPAVAEDQHNNNVGITTTQKKILKGSGQEGSPLNLERYPDNVQRILKESSSELQQATRPPPPSGGVAAAPSSNYAKKNHHSRNHWGSQEEQQVSSSAEVLVNPLRPSPDSSKTNSQSEFNNTSSRRGMISNFFSETFRNPSSPVVVSILDDDDLEGDIVPVSGGIPNALTTAAAPTSQLSSLLAQAEQGHKTTTEILQESRRFLMYSVVPHTQNLINRCKGLQAQADQLTVPQSTRGSMSNRSRTTESGNAGMTPRLSGGGGTDAAIRGNALREFKLQQLRTFASQLTELEAAKKKNTETVILDQNGDDLTTHFSEERAMQFEESLEKTRILVNAYLDEQKQTYADCRQTGMCLLQDANEHAVTTTARIDESRGSILAAEQSVYDEFTSGLSKFAEERRRVLIAKQHEGRTISEYDPRAETLANDVDTLTLELGNVGTDLEKARVIHSKMRGTESEDLKPLPRVVKQINVDDEEDITPAPAVANSSAPVSAANGGRKGSLFGALLGGFFGGGSGGKETPRPPTTNYGDQLPASAYTTLGGAPATGFIAPPSPSPAPDCPVGGVKLEEVFTVPPPPPLGETTATNPQQAAAVVAAAPIAAPVMMQSEVLLAPSVPSLRLSEVPGAQPQEQQPTTRSNAPPPSPAAVFLSEYSPAAATLASNINDAATPSRMSATKHSPRMGTEIDHNGLVIEQPEETSTSKVFEQRPLNKDDMPEDDGAEHQRGGFLGALGLGFFGGRSSRTVGNKADREADSKTTGTALSAQVVPSGGGGAEIQGDWLDDDEEDVDGELFRAMKRRRLD